jgi:AcrR family transcriptional regulator
VPRVKQRTPELRERVLGAAVATLAAQGVAGFTTRRVAQQAATSTPAVYELFGDRAGLVREVFFEGFRMLGRAFREHPETADPRADLVTVIATFRDFARDHPVLAQLMFSRPFADFDPGPAEQAAGPAVREFIVGRVRRAAEAGLLDGDPVDLAHILTALAQGLATQESAGWLGTSPESRDRRWSLAVEAVLTGLARPPGSAA